MKILTPVDQSRRDGIALPYCVRMTKALNASVVVVQAVPLTRSLIPNAVRQVEAYVCAVEASLREQGLTVEGIVRRGDPAAVIVSLAAELPADLILMTTRGRSGLGKFVLGSVADAVLANCSKPVLILSEAGNGVSSAEETRLQSAYLATVIWNKQARGLYSKEAAEKELMRLATSGLDRSVLFATYESHQQNGELFNWLDFDFQLSTLREFLPEEANALERNQPVDFSKKRAASKKQAA